MSDDINALLQRIDGYLGLWFHRHENLTPDNPLRQEVDLDMTLLRRINNDREHVLVAMPKCPACGGEGVEFAGEDDYIGDACDTCDGRGWTLP